MLRSFLSLVAAGLSATLFLGSQALAQAPAITDAQATAAVAEVREQVGERYFNDARRAEVVSALDAAQRAGRYATRDPVELAIRLTQDLGRVSGDGHMYINWNPEQQRSLLEPVRAADAVEDDTEYNRSRAQQRNHGLTDMRILPGNVRYLRLESFLWDGQASEAAYDGAMRFLKDGDAAIIDLRGNGGGSPDAVAYLTSHFVAPNTPLMRFVFAGGEERSQARGQLPAGRMIGKPLYVLIDQGVASAAEEFAMHVNKLRIGELVGAKTAGAGNRNALIPIAPGFVLSVSVASALHSTDGQGWEAVGIAPTMEAEPAKALDIAQLQAIQRLAAKAPPQDAARYAWALTALKARVEPVNLPGEALARYAGRFGERQVALKDGALTYQRQGGPEVPLTPLAADLFQFGPEDSGVRVRFVREGERVAGIAVTYEDGRELAYGRTG